MFRISFPGIRTRRRLRTGRASACRCWADALALRQCTRALIATLSARGEFRIVAKLHSCLREGVTIEDLVQSLPEAAAEGTH